MQLKNVISALFCFCFFNMVSWGMDSLEPVGIPADALITYREDQNGLAKDQLLQIIQEARKSIDFSAYQIKDPMIVEALKKKAQAGVSLRIIVEEDPYQHSFNKDDGQPTLLLSLMEVEVPIRGRSGILKMKYPKGHNHARYLIIDGQQLILTTGNFDETTFDHCRDFAVVVNKNNQQECLPLIQAIFESDWNDKEVITPHNNVSIILGPEDQREKIARFLNAAKEKVQIYQQYCNDPKIADLLIDLKKRGVDIQLLMMAYPTDYEKDPNKDTQDLLEKAGINVRLVNIDDRIYMHARSIIIDGSKALVGTASLSPPSLDLNRELSLIITGKVVTDLEKQFTKDWDKSVSLADGRKASLKEKLNWNQLFFKDLNS